ncbi:MAG: MerR family transcriptional regulator [Planctomycetota bacterium]|nr:MerR family transcriptional regulator [Planctomycetota bacterium]
MGKLTGYSLRELASLSGFRQRSIRNYIQQGLIPGANGKGRGAVYPNECLDGLLFLQTVRRKVNLGLDQERRLLMQLPPEQIRAIGLGEEALDIAAVEEESTLLMMAAPPLESPLRAAKSAPSEALSGNDELDFIRKLKKQNQTGPYTHKIPTHATSRIERAAVELEKSLPHRNPGRKARSEHWATISVTPDIELRARGLDGDDLASLERIADILRNLISKNQ